MYDWLNVYRHAAAVDVYVVLAGKSEQCLKNLQHNVTNVITSQVRKMLPILAVDAAGKRACVFFMVVYEGERADEMTPVMFYVCSTPL